MHAAGTSRLVRARAALPLALALLLALPLGACSSTKPGTPTTTTIAPDTYTAAFHAAKDALRASHFDLERVDAAAGVITTRPRSSAGIATPWLDYDETLAAGIDDLIHRDRRRAVVRFTPADQPGASPLVDRRTLGSPLVMSVSVEVERTYVIGRRADPTSIRLTSRAVDPQLPDRGVSPLSRDRVGEDEALAARILTQIEETMRPKTSP